MKKIRNMNAKAPWFMVLGLLAFFRLAAPVFAETPAAPADAPAAAAAPAATPATPAADPAAAPTADSAVTPAATPVSSPGDALAAAASVPAPKFAVVTFWPGAIIQARITSESMPWLDLDTLLRKGRFTAADEEDIPTTQRPPPEGKQYAILVVTLREKEKRSIGKYDFSLNTGAETIPCLAMSKDDKPYDQRLWEVPFGSSAEVNLLYEVPAGTTDATLMHALPVTLPQPDVPIHFMMDAPEAAPTPEAAPAAPAAPDAPATPPAASPETAAPAGGTAK